MESNYKIVPATHEDASSLASLVNSAYRGETSRKGWTTEADFIDGTRIDEAGVHLLLDRPGTLVLKYIEHEKIIGCVELATRGDELYLGMLTVSPELQGSGIGKKMLFEAEAIAKRQNLKAIVMRVLSERDTLIAWYKRHGYSETGAREPFAFTEARFGFPKRPLEFIVLRKEF